MLERIRIRDFKSLANVDVRLRPLTVLFGPNTAGKSNFLEGVVLFSRLVGERTLTEAFSSPIRGWPMEAFRLDEGGVAGMLARPRVQLELEADITFENNREGTRRDPLRYRVAVDYVPKSGELFVADEYLSRLDKARKPKESLKIAKHSEGRSDDACLLVRRKGAGRPEKYDLGLNHTIVSNLQLSGEGRYPDFDRLRSEVAAWRMYYLDPREVMRAALPPKAVEDIGPRGEWIAPFLYRLKTDSKLNKHFKAVSRSLRNAIPTIESLEVEIDEKRGALNVVVVQDGVPYSSRVISEGTLRVLAICSVAASPWPGSLIAFEEPENGVHPRRIETIARLLAEVTRGGSRQVVVTTHSPHLLGALMRLRRENEIADEHLGFLRCGQSPAGSSIQEMTPLPLFEDREIAEALNDPSEERVLDAILSRGWLDG
jgi:predicted ATPase